MAFFIPFVASSCGQSDVQADEWRQAVALIQAMRANKLQPAVPTISSVIAA